MNHEAWAIPYGDLVTLLLAFFVVMYAMSTVNEGKYRILSDSLVAAFRAAPKSLEPVQVGEPAKARTMSQTERPRTLVPLEMDEPEFPPEHEDELPVEYLRESAMEPEEIQAAAELIERLTDAIAEQLSELVAQDLVRLRRDRFWLEVEINTDVLFATGRADVAPQSLPVLRRISEVLTGTPVRVRVEGHSDAVPIRTVVYPSNWELSAGRAATVVRLFAEHGMAPDTLAAVGFGEHRPVAGNDTAAGRNRNRRVVIVVMAHRDDLLRENWATDEHLPVAATVADPPQVSTL